MALLEGRSPSGGGEGKKWICFSRIEQQKQETHHTAEDNSWYSYPGPIRPISTMVFLSRLLLFRRNGLLFTHACFYRWIAALTRATFPDLSKCTKHIKAHQARSTFWSWDVEKVHAVVARSTFRSQHVQNTPGSDHLWKLRWWKVHAVVARSTFPSQHAQSTPGSDHFWKLR